MKRMNIPATVRRFGMMAVLCALMSAIVLCGRQVAVAADIAEIDADATGSIAVTLADAQGEPVGGGAFAVYKVADLDLSGADPAYAYVKEFESCPIDLSAVTADLKSVDLATVADGLAAYADESCLEGQPLIVDENGKARIDDVPLGLYLIVQAEALEGYDAVLPFLVSIPLDDGDAWIYDIDATPKVEAAFGPTAPFDGDEKDDEDAEETYGELIDESQGEYDAVSPVPLTTTALTGDENGEMPLPAGSTGANGSTGSPGSTGSTGGSGGGTGGAGGSKLPQTGDPFSSLVARILPFVIGAVLICAGVVVTYAIRRPKRRLSIAVRRGVPTYRPPRAAQGTPPYAPRERT